MNCREARRMVTPFINHELSDRETEHFLRHVEHCSECMDELETYFMVYRAIDTLDTGAHHKENDFQKMLGEEIRSAKRGILTRRGMMIFRVLLMTLAEVFMLLSIFIGYENRSEDAGKHAFHRAIYGMRSETEGEKETYSGAEAGITMNAVAEVEKLMQTETDGVK